MGLWANVQNIFGIVAVPADAGTASVAARGDQGSSPVVRMARPAATKPVTFSLASEKHAPVILISGQKADSDSVKAAVAMVRAQGNIPMVVTEHAGRDVAKDLARADGMVLLGNDYDIDPALYGQPPGAHTLSEADPDLARKAEAKKGAPLTAKEAAVIANVPRRAQYETELLGAALAQKVPVLGICGGMQRMNVLLHGDIRQHIPDDVGDDHHMQTAAPYVPVLPVTIDPDSTLGALGQGIRTIMAPRPGATGAQPLVLMENSFHHQAVGKLGQGLKASATYADAFTAEDGGKHRLTAGIEADPAGPYGQQFLVGTQWHPEFGASPLGPRIFAGLSDAAKARAAEMASDPARLAARQEEHDADRPGWMTDILRQHEKRQRGDALGTPQDAILPSERKNAPNPVGMAR